MFSHFFFFVFLNHVFLSWLKCILIALCFCSSRNSLVKFFLFFVNVLFYWENVFEFSEICALFGQFLCTFILFGKFFFTLFFINFFDPFLSLFLNQIGIFSDFSTLFSHFSYLILSMFGRFLFRLCVNFSAFVLFDHFSDKTSLNFVLYYSNLVFFVEFSLHFFSFPFF